MEDVTKLALWWIGSLLFFLAGIVVGLTQGIYGTLLLIVGALMLGASFGYILAAQRLKIANTNARSAAQTRRKR
jgi:uncharacterized protein HemX